MTPLILTALLQVLAEKLWLPLATAASTLNACCRVRSMLKSRCSPTNTAVPSISVSENAAFNDDTRRCLRKLRDPPTAAAFKKAAKTAKKRKK